MRTLIASLVPAVLRHLEAYAEVAGEDVRDAATLLARKLAAILIAVAAAFVALIMLCLWLVALAWDGPWRNWVAGGLALGIALAAVVLALPVLRPKHGPPEFFSRTRTEFGRDRAMLERAFDKRRPDGSGGEDDRVGP
ncbi:MAG: hypothetical protein FJ171_11695 [Gammaproteobacteria bacterium]|nr:hypothetical protein [Gammaproteobacteria bacterium]